MSSRFDKMIKDFVNSIKENKKEIGPYDTTATVIRIEENTAYVHIPGGIEETPVSKTIDCKIGDIVQLRVGGGRAWIVGNATAPPTDDTTAIKASGTATKFITDMVNGIFVHRENDTKNGVKITDVIDIIRDGFKAATYGEETIFYEPKSNKIAAKIGNFGLKIVNGIISLGSKTSASDVTNPGTYIDANGNMATSNINAHGGTIGNFNIEGDGWLKTTDGNTWLKDGLQVENTISNIPYIARYFPNEAYLAKNVGNTSGSIVDITPTEVRVTANDGNKESKLSATKLDIYGDESAGIVSRVVLSNRSEGVELQLAVSGNRGIYDTVNNTWVLYKRPMSANSYPNCTFVRGDEVILQNEEDTSEFIRYLCNSNGTNCLIPSTNNKIHLGLPSYKWANIHATSSDIGSDLKTKEVIENFDWKIDEFIKGLKPIAYKLKDEDGNPTKRIKMGFGAQDVAQLSKDIKLGDMSLYNAVIVEKGENGNINEKLYNGEEINDNKLVWSLRYYEFIAPIVMELQRLMNRVDKLEQENKTLKEHMKVV